MRLEENKRYVTRCGFVTSKMIESAADNTNFPFITSVNKLFGAWTEDGSFHAEDTRKSIYDIISEYNESGIEMKLLTSNSKVKVIGIMGESYKARILVNDGGDKNYPYVVEYFNNENRPIIKGFGRDGICDNGFKLVERKNSIKSYNGGSYRTISINSSPDKNTYYISIDKEDKSSTSIYLNKSSLEDFITILQDAGNGHD